MTSPIGKILLTKLPKDIIQYCIEPYFMISKEQARKNYDEVVKHMWYFSIDKFVLVEYMHDGSQIHRPYFVNGDEVQQWRLYLFTQHWREQQRKKKYMQKSCCTIL